MPKILRILLLCLMAGLTLFGYRYGAELLDGVSYPWAHAWFGRPTLTGTWRGPINFGEYGTRSLELTLLRENYLPGGRESYLAEGGFEGTAQMKDAQGNVFTYEIGGKANRNASVITFNFSERQRQASPEKRPSLSNGLTGSWDGQTLTLSGKAELILFDGQSSKYNSDDPTLTVTSKLNQTP